MERLDGGIQLYGDECSGKNILLLDYAINSYILGNR